PACLASPCSRRPLRLFIRPRARNLLPPLPFPGKPARIVHLFHRRAPEPCPRWLVPQRRDEVEETQQENSMKYLMMILAAIALVGTASATSRSADCCDGGMCCMVNSSCCAK